MKHDSALIVELSIQSVGDQFYATSQDVPGLHVCGNTRAEACDSAIAALKFLLKHNRGIEVGAIYPAADVRSFPAPAEQCDRFVALAA